MLTLCHRFCTYLTITQSIPAKRTKSKNTPQRHYHAFTPCPKKHTHYTHLPPPSTSDDIEQLLQLHQQLPLVLTDIAPEELLERVNTLAADGRVQRVVFLEVAAVHGLIWAFDFDGDGGLALFADLDLLVVAFDAGAVKTLIWV